MSSSNSPVKIESRKFLASINDSAQSKVALFESLVANIGKKAGQKLRLVSLNEDKLFMEDVRSNQYYQADHKKIKGGRVDITNVRPIEIHEGKKQNLFEQECNALIKAIEENDQKGMKTAWNNIQRCKFTGRTIPESGLIRTRDNVVRTVKVADDAIIDEHTKSRLVAALVESVTNRVVLENGKISSASFNSNPEVKIPISEWTCRKVVGNHMREAAQKAYLSEGFQNRIRKVASLINGDKIDEAVKLVKDFLFENQEFCLIRKKETLRLIENTLATNAIFNQKLCEDTATLFYRTNLKVNKADIIKEWKAAGMKAQHPVLLENVDKLENSKNFDESYNTFLDMIFNEAMSPRDEEIASYRQALEMLRNTAAIKEDTGLRSKLDELLTRLNESDVDDATVNVVRETLAAAKKEVGALDKLDNFDQMPGMDEEDDFTEELGGEIGGELGGGGQPTVVINSPLINFGSAGDAGGEDLGGLGGGDDEMVELGGGEEDELGGLDGLGSEEEEDDLGGLEGLGLESKNRKKAIAESAIRKAMNLPQDQDLGKDWDKLMSKISSKADELTPAGRGLRRKLNESTDWENGERPWDKDKDNDPDDTENSSNDSDDMNFGEEDDCDESRDPYAFDDTEVAEGLGKDYGVPALGEDLQDVVNSMFNIIEEQQSDVNKVDLNKLAKAAIQRSGVRLPENRINEAIKQASDEFSTKLSEDQYKFLDNQQRGRANRAKSRSSFEKKHDVSGGGSTENNLPDDSGPMESTLRDKVTLVEQDHKNNGVKFEHRNVEVILDYAEPPVLTSLDGQVEVPVPKNLLESAFGAANVIKSDPKPFMLWLSQGIEQFRPLSDDNDLSEAVANIRTSPDGTIDISIDGEDPGVNIDNTGMGGMEDQAGMEDPEMGPEIDGIEGYTGDEIDDDAMEPVSDMGGEGPGPDVDAVPDFEGEAGSDVGPEVGTDEGDDLEVEEEADDAVQQSRDAEKMGADAMLDEDNDMTDPAGDYNTADDELRDMSKQAGKSVPKGNGNNLDGWSGKTKNDTTGKKDTEMKDLKPGKNRQGK